MSSRILIKSLENGSLPTRETDIWPKARTLVSSLLPHHTNSALLIICTLLFNTMWKFCCTDAYSTLRERNNKGCFFGFLSGCLCDGLASSLRHTSVPSCVLFFPVAHSSGPLSMKTQGYRSHQEKYNLFFIPLHKERNRGSSLPFLSKALFFNDNICAGNEQFCKVRSHQEQNEKHSLYCMIQFIW